MDEVKLFQSSTVCYMLHLACVTQSMELRFPFIANGLEAIGSELACLNEKLNCIFFS